MVRKANKTIRRIVLNDEREATQLMIKERVHRQHRAFLRSANWVASLIARNDGWIYANFLAAAPCSAINRARSMPTGIPSTTRH